MSLPTGNQVCHTPCPLAGERYSDYVRNVPRNNSHKSSQGGVSKTNHIERQRFFNSLGKTPEYYNVGFESLLQTPYLMNCNRLQDFGSDTCGLYCVYYVMCRYAEMTIKDLVRPFNVRELNTNDMFVKLFMNNNN